MEFNKKNIKTIMLLVVFTIAVYKLFEDIGSIIGMLDGVIAIFSTIILGLALAFVVNVPMKLIEKHILVKVLTSEKQKKFIRPLALLLSYLIMLTVFSLLFYVAVPQLRVLGLQLMEGLPSFTASAISFIEEIFVALNISTEAIHDLTIDWEAIFSKVTSFLTTGLSGVLGTATSVGASVVSFVTNFIFAFVISLYTLASKETVGEYTKKLVSALFSDKISKKIFHVAKLCNDTFSSFISGQVTEAIILGSLCFIGMKIFKMPYAEVISVVVAVFALVPIVGGIFSATLGTVLILFTSPLTALGFLVFLTCLQQIEGTLIYPRVVGKSVGLPGGLVFVAVVLGGNFGGILGTLLAVPVCAVLFSLVNEFIENRT